MIRHAPTSGVLLLAVALGLSLVAAPSSAEPPVVDAPVELPSATPDAPSATPDAPSATPDAPSATRDAPTPALPPSAAPPPLDPVEVPPAFDAQDAGGFLWSFVKSMLMLGVVLALIYLVLHKGLGRLVSRTQMGRRMRVVERIALDQRRALYLVEVDGQEVLLAASEGGVVAVDLPGRDATGDKREAPATPAAPSARFQDELSKPGRAPPETGKDEQGQSLVQRAKARQGADARETAEG